MNRRVGLAFLATGLLAAGFGAALHGWRTSPTDPDPASLAALFAATFPDADGAAQPLAQWRGRPLVVNFWATWCPPCVDEMPDLQRVRDHYREQGVEIIGIGIDNADKIASFRDRHRISLPLLVAGAGGSDLNRALGNSSGALPFTVVIAADGTVAQRHLGRVQPEQLTRWLDAVLGRR